MISVCLTTYNGEKYIKEQLDSILNQLGENDEVIISDDGSTDRTLDVIAQIGDNRITVLHHESCGKTSFIKAKNNFENALKHAKGDYIFLADQDDIWKPEKVKVFMEYLGTYECVESDAELTAQTPYTVGHLEEHRGLLANTIYLPFRGCCMAFTKDLLDLVLPIPDSVITHDAWIGCCAVARKKYFKIKEDLISYRIHDNNVSVGKNNNTFAYKIYYRICLLFNVIVRCWFKGKK